MKHGPFLNNDKTLYLIATSFGCTISPYKERLDKAISNFKDKNINVFEGKYIRKKYRLLASTPKIIADEFLNAYKNFDMIQSVGGGEAMIEILPYINFEKIKKLPPKFFMGYSDNTVLTFLLPTICDVMSIYGGCAPEFGSNTLIDYQLDQINLIKGLKFKFKGYPMYEIESLKDDDPYSSLNLTEKSVISTCNLNDDYIEGRIIGGCIDVVSTLIGTKYDNIKSFNEKYDDIIWFFEACDMTPIEVYRRLLQMKYANWFIKAKAFVFGRPLNKKIMFDKDYKDYIIYALKDLNLPIIFDLDIGHVKPQIPVIVGSKCKINVYDNTYDIEYILE